MREDLRRFILSHVPTQTVAGTVVAVDKARAVCNVQPADEGAPVLLDVQLRAVDDGSAAGFVLWPVEGSPVLVGLIDNDPNSCVVVATSQVERVTLATEGENLHTLLHDLVAAVRALKFTTNQGPTIQLLTDATWARLDARIDKLLRP